MSAEARERLQQAIYVAGPTEKILQKLRRVQSDQRVVFDKKNGQRDGLHISLQGPGLSVVMEDSDSSVGESRRPAPPAASSPDAQAQVAGVKSFARTNTTNHSAWFWQPAFITPWLDTINLEIFQNHLGEPMQWQLNSREDSGNATR